MKHIILAVLLAVLLICGTTQAINENRLRHRLLQRESTCTDQCTKMYKNNIDKCMSICTDIVMNKKATDKVFKAIAKEEAEEAAPGVERVLSDIPEEASKQQEEATKHLWELYHRNMRQLLANGGWSAGFQILANSFDLTDITTIPGWESMPLGALAAKTDVQDYDNMAILAEELNMVSKVGPMRITDGTKLVDEYKAYLSGVAGINSIVIPDPDYTLSAQATQVFEWALHNCTEKYSMASPLIIERYTMEQYGNIFCPQVKQTERAMFAQIGKEQAAIGNNPAYAAAVALGMAQGLFTMSTAFKKYQSFRSMEYECQMASIEGRTMKGNAKSFEFSYNYNTWKNTKESSGFSVSVGYQMVKVGFNQQKEVEKGFDLTAIGGVAIGFADLRYIPLYPGDWYSSTAFKDFRYYSRESGAAPITRFFGTPDSSLALFPKALVVGLNPSIGFEVKTEKKETFKKSTEMAVEAGLDIAGINLSGSYKKAKVVDEGTVTGGNSKITIKSESCKPQLLAIEHQYVY
jgi:hypothetical protein